MINTVAARATVVMPGLAEGRLLTGASEPDDIAQFYLRARRARSRDQARRAGRPRAGQPMGETVQSRAFAVTPIDTVGAGDGFAAGYLAAFLAGGSLQERVDQGAAVGALVTTRRGDLAAMPTADVEVDELHHPATAVPATNHDTASTAPRYATVRSSHPDQDTLTADVVIIGSGMGGGTLAWALKDTGLDVLIVERGQFLPREPENSQPDHVFIKKRYVTSRPWYDAKTGQPFQPGVYYWVGGNTKMYGACLPRFRRSDFEEVAHHDGVSPAWPFSYDDLEPFYAKAEELFEVHGAVGEDPTEPEHSTPYPYPPLSHEPAVERLAVRLRQQGLHPFHMANGMHLPSMVERRADTTADGSPSSTGNKSDAENRAVRPALESPTVRLLLGAYVRRLHTNSDGRRRHGCGGGCRRADRTDRGQDLRRVRRSGQLGRLAAALGQRPASQGTRQLLGPARPQLHGPQQHILLGGEPCTPQ